MIIQPNQTWHSSIKWIRNKIVYQKKRQFNKYSLSFIFLHIFNMNIQRNQTIICRKFTFNVLAYNVFVCFLCYCICFRLLYQQDVCYISLVYFVFSCVYFCVHVYDNVCFVFLCVSVCVVIISFAISGMGYKWVYLYNK